MFVVESSRRSWCVRRTTTVIPRSIGGNQRTAATEVEDGIRLNYFDTTWAKVLKDVAESQEMTLVMDSVPPGRFARRDKKQYDLDTAIRILNKELEPQGYRLLVQKSYLIVLNLDKARTEYSRPSIKTDGSTEQERTPATES
jgi:general secretion pathway protein D